MHINNETHKERMAKRREAYHERVSDVPPWMYNTSKYMPRIDTPKEKRNAR